jgi:cell division protein FtsW (lipid II flippase)
MIILFGLFLPLAAYIALYLMSPQGRLVSRTPWAASAAALWATLAVLFVLFSSPHFPEGTQIAWVGVETAAPTLTIGGAVEGASFGYPNGSFAPEMKLASASGGAASVEIKGGGGFVLDETKKAFLNGSPISPGETKTYDPFGVRVSDSWRAPFSHFVEVLDAGGHTLVGFWLPRSSPNRVYSLESLVSKNAGELRKDAGKLLQVEDWATDLKLLVPDAGDLRVLARDGQSSAQCALPCRLTVLWPGQRLPLTLNSERAKLSVRFEPPWRLTSPVPPAESDQPARLTVTAEPLPGDHAFLMPFGNGMGSVREPLSISPASPRVFTASGGQTPDAARGEAGITSRTTVASGGNGFVFATVHNLPSPWKVAGLLLLALLPFVAGLALVSQRVGVAEGTTRWVLCGLALTLWNLLVFRVLLALRYALDPSYLDSLVVKGVVVAFVGLALAPGVVLLSARLYHDMRTLPDDLAPRRLARNNVRAYLVLLVGAFFAEYFLAPHLWADLPARLTPSLGWYYRLPILFVILVPFALVRVLYMIPEKEGEAAGRAALRRVFLFPLRFGEGFAGGARRLWARMSVGSRPLLKLALGAARDAGTRAELWQRLRALALAALVYSILAVLFFLLVPAVISRVPAQKFFQDLIIPLLFCWLPALFWVSPRAYFRPDGVRRPLSLVILALCALLTICLPVFIVPVVIRDAGGMVATLAFFIPVVFVLLAVGSWRVGLAAFLSIALALAAAQYIYANFLTTFPYLPGEARVRLLTFKEGSKVEEYLPTAEVEDAGGIGLPLQKLRDGYQHAWQTMAVAHEGGWTGLGFGNGPARRSQVRQDTLQFDSAFSFFVVGEYGLLGGACLLLIFGAPLALVLISGRRRFDTGHAAAAVVAGALLLEALAHAGMNLGLLPLTGRNLPVTTVNSITDLLRWTLLFAFVAQATLWRNRPQGDRRDESLSLLSADEADGVTQTTTGAGASAERLPRYVLAAAVMLLVPAALFALVVRANREVAADKSMEQPFSWEGMLRAVRRMINDKEIVLHGDAGEPNPWLELNRPGTGTQFVEQEIARFNALPLSEKIEESRLADLPDRLGHAATLDEYNQIMDEARRRTMMGRKNRRPSLFRLLPPRRWLDETFVWHEGEYRFTTNPAFNSQLSFHTTLTPDRVPRVTLRGEPEPLIGPAWVMGRWAVAYKPDPLFPWLGQLAEAMTDEWARLGRDEARKRYGVLALDRNLQQAAARAAADKGRSLFEQLLSENRTAQTKKILMPPRVALAAVSLPSGEVLALAGYPRASSDRYWHKGADGKEWLPSINWLQQEAPRAVRGLYEGDRNFDTIVVGSSTKPLWASAVLAVHPNLDRQLLVRGTGGRESEVFGITLDRDWHVSETGWVDFKTYLTRSDNRYQVRLGFLGLADAAGGDVVAGGASQSDRESLGSRTPEPWRKYPQFSGSIGFSPKQHSRMTDLQNTALARALKTMFSVGVGRDDFPRRISFWTGAEADDLPRAPDDPKSKYPYVPSGLLDALSPTPPHFALDTIDDSGAYVSLLLGGGTNLWSNVDFAGAFATCVTGQPVLAHVTAGATVKTLDGRGGFPGIAAKLRPGLEGVVNDPAGTAHGKFQATKALDFLNSLRGIKVYAKTGTLQAQGEDHETSRLVIALVRWADERQGKVKKGLVFSVVEEQAQTGAAAQWLGEFLYNNRAFISQYLSD